MTDQNEAVNASQTIPTSERLQVAHDRAVAVLEARKARETATFDHLVFGPHPNHREPGAIQARMQFPNGYGASVVRGSIGPGGGTYGCEQGLYELAVTKGPDFRLCYTTPITGDVLGYLTPDDVTTHLRAIADLPGDALEAAPL